MPHPISIRCSSLPGYNDCSRRQASKDFRKRIVAAGWELRELMPSVGAAVGTAVHAANAHRLKAKIETGELAPLADGVENAMIAFKEEISPGVEWDATTPNVQAAEYQIRRMAEVYSPVASAIEAVFVERELRMTVAEGCEVVGHVDVYEGGAGPGPDDTKTGALLRPYQAQLGGYSLLLRAAQLEVEKCSTTFIRRVRQKNPIQPPADRKTYDVGTCEQAAYSTIQDIRRDVTAFDEQQKPEVFRANPMSLMCSPKYCPAFGTKFCTLHLTKETDHGPID